MHDWTQDLPEDIEVPETLEQLVVRVNLLAEEVLRRIEYIEEWITDNLVGKSI